MTAEESWGTLERLVNNGDVIYVGTSNFPGWGLAKFQMQALQRGFMASSLSERSAIWSEPLELHTNGGS